MPRDKEQRCGKDLRKFLFVVCVIAVFIVIGSYWYTSFYANGKLSALWANNTSAATAVSPSGGAFTPAAARSITVAVSPFRGVAAFMKSRVVNISARQSSSVLKPAVAKTQDNTGGALKFTNPFTGAGVESIGSGIIVTRDGYILTNYHVVEKATQVYVTVFRPQGAIRSLAQIARMSETLDLALLKIEPGFALSPASMGDSEKLMVGDPILAIGSPFGLDQTVSQGIISSKRKSIVIEGVNHKNLLQTDAAINQGNSGGPLVDINGYVVGVNTAIYTPTGAFAGIGFSVPVNEAREFLEELITLPKMRPNLKGALKWDAGARSAFAAPVAAKTAPSIRANAVSPHGDRGPCGNCHRIIGQSAPARQGSLGFSMNPGGAVGMNAAMQAGAAPIRQGLKQNWFGAEVQRIDQVIARSFNSPVVNGAFVNSVYTSSPAQAAGLKPGDIIFKIDGRRFDTPQDLLKLVNSYKTGDTARVSIFRNGARRNLYLHIDKAPSTVNPALQPVLPQTGAANQPMFWGNKEAPARLQTGATPPLLPKEFSWVGMELEPLRLNEAANDPGFTGKSGALVVEISPGSPADMAGLISGDLIVAINRTPVGTAEALNRAIWLSAEQNGALLEVDRSNQRMFVTIR
ncbi:MAG TPA: PDZ domain-containing protein [Nitrospirae bacterium]|nr:PDZ domain-containing protein [Nitrospirota bacterium]